MIKAIIFDLDDTLISENQYIESGYRHIASLLCKRLGEDEIELYEILIKLFKENPKNVFNRILDKYEVNYTNDSIINLVQQYRNHLPHIVFFNDVIPVLEILKMKGIKLGIITDGYANAQRQKLNVVKAYGYFDEVIITDELGRKYWKPHSRPFELMREKMNVEFNEMIYVGDNPEKDFYISKLYPIKTVRIQRQGIYKDRSYFEDIKEDYLIYSLNELCRYVE